MIFQPRQAVAAHIAFNYLWPWIGLGAGGVLLVLLFATDILRKDLLTPRWRDLVWLTWAATCAYLIHQFEEHGVDAAGDVYAFRGGLCAVLGFEQPSSCPIPAAFITAVNIPFVWLAGPISALLGLRWPVIALSFFSVVFVNALVHFAGAFTQGGYNPGLLIAVVIFLPLSLWTFAVAYRSLPAIATRAILATVAAGVAVHMVLLGSIAAYLRGWIGRDLLILVQVVNPVIPALFVLLATGFRGASPR